MDKKKLNDLYKVQAFSKQPGFECLKNRLVENQRKTLEYFEEGINRDSIIMLRIVLRNFQGYNLIITDEHLETAQKKSKKIFDFLKKSQETIVEHLITTLDPIDALKILLNYKTPPMRIVTNL